MAYAVTMLQYRFYGGAGHSEWNVVTTDAKATAVADNYLDLSIARLKVDDLIWFYCSDSVCVRRVTSVTTHVTVAALG